MIKQTLENLKTATPIVHCITNHVTSNDCANILLAAGAAPIMADDKNEAAEVTASADALVLNLGTPSENKLEAMLAAGKTANDIGLPIVFDPVGVGVSDFRMNAAKTLLSELSVSLIRGNFSEIRSLCGGEALCLGVDVNADESEELSYRLDFARRLFEKTGAVVLISGKCDVIGADRAAVCRGGSSLMSQITGAGCQLSCLCGAVLAVNTEDAFSSAVCASALMKLAGERAKSRMSGEDGSFSMRGYIIDAVGNITPDELERSADYELL